MVDADRHQRAEQDTQGKHPQVGAVTDYAVGSLDRLQRVMVLGDQVADGAALAAENDRFRLRPQIVIDNTVQEFSVRDPGSGEGDILALDQVLAGVRAMEGSQRRHCRSPPRHLSAQAARTASDNPPTPIMTSIPVPSRVAMMAAAISPSLSRLMRAPTCRTCSIIGSCRGRSSITTVRSETCTFLANATRCRLFSTESVTSMDPRASGPTAIFSA